MLHTEERVFYVVQKIIAYTQRDDHDGVSLHSSVKSVLMTINYYLYLQQQIHLVEE